MLICPRCGVLARFLGFLSRLAESQFLSVVGVFFPGPASAPCSVVDRFLYQSGHSLFLGVEKFCLSWKERSLFFRIGGREESHKNLVVASLSNFQTTACMSMSPGGARHHNRKYESGLRPAKKPKSGCPPAKNLLLHVKPCTNLWVVFIQILTIRTGQALWNQKCCERRKTLTQYAAASWWSNWLLTPMQEVRTSTPPVSNPRQSSNSWIPLQKQPTWGSIA